MPSPAREITGIMVLAFSILLGPGLLSYQFGEGMLMGPLGDSLARAAYALFGLCSYLIVLILAVVAARVLADRPLVPRVPDLAGYGVTALGAMIICHLVGASTRIDGYSAGGIVGEFSGELARAGMGTPGAAVVALTFLVSGLVMASELSIVGLVRHLGAYISLRRARLAAAMPPEPLIVVARPKLLFRKKDRNRKDQDKTKHLEAIEPEDSEEPTMRMTSPSSLEEPEAKKPTPKMFVPTGPTIVEPEYRKNKKPPELPRPKRPKGEFRLPDLELLGYENQPASDLNKDEMRHLAERLSTSLASYKVNGHVSEIHPGPVVTMYEFVPEPGTRLSKISNLSGDLAMALKAARPVRIVSPLPGKGAVGIEVPNHTREKVFLREILADPIFAQTKARLPLCMGKDIYGCPIAVDLQRMPHLLVAGTTGSGKSVALNAMITSLLYHATPEQVRLILVDPKMVELSIYEGIPHLLLPVVTEPQQAALALRWAVDEMERRYRLIYEAKVRHLEQFNEKQKDPNERLPYLVVVIDEFADLMTTAPKEVECSVQRLAQKARAAGIHVILATQRPSVDVITAVIKSNFPVRIAFYVKDGINSRVILDQHGAETLLGAGDMLYQDKGLQIQRVHGCFVSEEEVRQVTDYLREQGPPSYEMDILKPREDEAARTKDEAATDAFYEQAIEFVRATGLASISRLQRELGVGYNRAAKMIERMERDGIVGPSDGAKPRQVLEAHL